MLDNDFAGRFAPCVADRLLLKTVPAKVRHAVAQKVLLYLTDGLRRIDLGFEQSASQRLQTQTNKHDDFNRHGVLRGKTSLRKTQQPNLNMKGRNQRQINE